MPLMLDGETAPQAPAWIHEAELAGWSPSRSLVFKLEYRTNLPSLTCRAYDRVSDSVQARRNAYARRCRSSRLVPIPGERIRRRLLRAPSPIYQHTRTRPRKDSAESTEGGLRSNIAS